MFEGGAATLIVTPAGESILIDSGNPGGPRRERIFEIADKTAHLKQIDYLVTTHYHIDHFGGAAELSGMIPIKTVYDNGTFEGGWEKPSRQYALFRPKNASSLIPADTLPLKQLDGAPAVSIQCIGTRQKVHRCAEGCRALPGLRGRETQVRGQNGQRQQRGASGSALAIFAFSLPGI